MPSHYNRYILAAKLSILEAARSSGDWETISNANNVNVNSARSWLRRYPTCADAMQTVPRGCKRAQTMTAEGVAILLSQLSIDPDLTLRQLADRVEQECSISVCPQTTKNHMGANLITMKQFHKELQYMNTEVNKLKRREFLVRLQQLQAMGKSVIYTNACIGSGGVILYETKLGSNKYQYSTEFIRNVLRKFNDVSNLVVVLDNPPCHARVESVFEEPEFEATTWLRLGPYSPMLNPVENVFSAFKSAVKDFMTERRAEIIEVPPGTTMKVHRQQILKESAGTLFPRVATSQLCVSCYRQTLRFHVKVTDLEDMPVGR